MAKKFFELEKQEHAEVMRMVRELADQHHLADTASVRIGLLFVADPTAPGAHVLEHQGYAAAALARIVPTRDRASGMPDVQIVVDFATWESFTHEQRCALLDHELQHFERKLDKEGRPKEDVQGRPAMQIRKHDHQYGWFDVVAERWGLNSIEVGQAKRLLESVGQLYFDFGDQKDAA